MPTVNTINEFRQYKPNRILCLENLIRNETDDVSQIKGLSRDMKRKIISHFLFYPTSINTFRIQVANFR